MGEGTRRGGDAGRAVRESRNLTLREPARLSVFKESRLTYFLGSAAIKGKAARILWEGHKRDHSHISHTQSENTQTQRTDDQAVPIFYTARLNKQTHGIEIEVSLLYQSTQDKSSIPFRKNKNVHISSPRLSCPEFRYVMCRLLNYLFSELSWGMYNIFDPIQCVSDIADMPQPS